MKTIFPREILDFTLEIHRFNFLKRSHMIYLILLFSLFGLGLSLPFIKIDLYSSSFGMIRPSKEKNMITSPINGKVNEVHISENSSVQKGDTLLTLDASFVSKEINLLKKEFDSLSLFIHDIKLLSQATYVSSDSLETDLYKSLLIQYRQKLKTLQDKCDRLLVQFKRQNHLYKKGVIATVDIEAASYELDKAKNEFNYFKRHQKSIWLGQLDQKTTELNQVSTKLLSLKQHKEFHFITAPSAGNVQEFKDLEKNNFLYAGSAIAEISPQTDLMVECYISPSEIGLIKNNHPVTFQIDAFNHHRWGSATGKIIRINHDVSSINKLPMYKVLCSINEKNLFLNETIRGRLQKGMTLTALFFIENRSLFQLLFDELEDWLDPGTGSNV